MTLSVYLVSAANKIHVLNLVSDFIIPYIAYGDVDPKPTVKTLEVQNFLKKNDLVLMLPEENTKMVSMLPL